MSAGKPILAIAALAAIAGFATAKPASALCYMDLACEPYQWDRIDNRIDCQKRLTHCREVNQCWRTWFPGPADDHLKNSIEPSYFRCVERVGSQ